MEVRMGLHSESLPLASREGLEEGRSKICCRLVGGMSARVLKSKKEGDGRICIRSEREPCQEG